MKTNKRKSFLINRPFQIKVMALFLALAIGIIGCWFLGNQFFFWRLFKQGQELGFPANHVYFRFIETQRQNMMLYIGALSVIVCSSIIIFGLRLSNKIAGPLHNLNQRLLEISKTGKLNNPIKFRDEDFFIELADSTNAAIDAIEKNKGA